MRIDGSIEAAAVSGAIHRVRERRAVRLDQLQRSARHRVRVGAAAGDEERRRPRVPPFQRGLGDARVIAVELNEPVLQRRVVARVPEDDRKRDTVGAVNPQHGHGAIDRTERSECHAPVGGKAGFVARVREPRRTRVEIRRLR